MTNPIAIRVAARFTHAHKTVTYEHVEQMFKKVLDPLRSLNFSFSKPSDANALAQKLAEASRELLGELHYEAESPALDHYLKDNKAKIVNFRKMLQAWADAPTWELLEPVLQSQGTRSRGAFEKAFEYRDFALGLIGAFDTEHEGNVRIGPFNVALLSAANYDWSDDALDKLRTIMSGVQRAITRIGLRSLLGGTVFAYPSERLPPAALTSHSAVAAYSRNNDTLFLAVGRADDKLLGSTTHELGHRAYFKIVSPNGRAAWTEFFDSNVGAPDVDSLIQDWENYISTADSNWDRSYGRTLSAYHKNLEKRGEKERLKWLELIAMKFDLHDKDLSGARGGGKLKKGGKWALDQLIAKKGEIKVFLHPITAYSGTKPEELFAETFREYALEGPARIPEIVRDAFRRALTGFSREAQEGETR